MGQVVSIPNNLARTKRPIAVRRLNNFEGRLVLSSTDTCTTSSGGSTLSAYLTTSTSGLYHTAITAPTNTTPTSLLTQLNPQHIATNMIGSTTLSDSTLTKHPISTTASGMLSSLALTNHSTPAAASASPANVMTPTPAPSQRHDYRIPLIVVGCIAGLFILTTAIIFIIRHLRKIQYAQGEVRSTIFGNRIPQPTPMIGGTLHKQQPPSSDKLDRSLPRPVAMRQQAQRDQQPRRIASAPGAGTTVQNGIVHFSRREVSGDGAAEGDFA